MKFVSNKRKQQREFRGAAIRGSGGTNLVSEVALAVASFAVGAIEHHITNGRQERKLTEQGFNKQAGYQHELAGQQPFGPRGSSWSTSRELGLRSHATYGFCCLIP